MVLGAAGVVGCFALFEAAGRFGLIPRDVLPYASTVLAAAGELALDAEFRGHVLITVSGCAAGLAIAVGLAVPAGLVLGALPAVERSVRPLVEFLRPIPSVSLIPLAMFLFPDSADAKTALVVITCCWPLLVNTLYGLADVDPLAKETLRGFGFGAVAVAFRVSLPSAAPFIATGGRIALSATVVVAVSGELIAGGEGGIGVFLVQAGGADRADWLPAATVWTGLLGLAANALFTAVEKRLFRWHWARTEEAP
ncbi:ABC transporter permease [Nonomuraea sp. NPDC050691]|uniref:ABC transporter permease n=1 Tax=Nonomuraea sp. NPDC050691 TaxID=3155661 RepID=UPI0033E29CAA